VKNDVDIRPGDTLSVSRSGVVYIIGDVGRPGGYLIENNGHLTILQALALAQAATARPSSNTRASSAKTEVGREEYAITSRSCCKTSCRTGR